MACRCAFDAAAIISVLLSTRMQTEASCDHAVVTCCRRPHFRQVKQWLAVQNKKLADLSKDSGPGTGALKGKAKKQARSHIAFQHPPQSLCPTSGGSPLWDDIAISAVQERIENSMKMETGRLFATMKMQQVGLVSAFVGAFCSRSTDAPIVCQFS